MSLIIDPQTNERVYELCCHCGEKGGEIRFPENHGRDSDQALEQELNTIYSHTCDQHTQQVIQ
ncbi:MAG TPA: hypothetical protein VKW08_00395 [Xanthobacteraceae bacterium]|nr:hypothetical protein [Xanthobacteraceae bacterium]